MARKTPLDAQWISTILGGFCHHGDRFPPNDAGQGHISDQNPARGLMVFHSSSLPHRDPDVLDKLFRQMGLFQVASIIPRTSLIYRKAILPIFERREDRDRWPSFVERTWPLCPDGLACRGPQHALKRAVESGAKEYTGDVRRIEALPLRYCGSLPGKNSSTHW